jgi:hypothetical protein
MIDVIQRTEDGVGRRASRTSQEGTTHTPAVDVSCDKSAEKCVEQVETGKEP